MVLKNNNRGNEQRTEQGSACERYHLHICHVNALFLVSFCAAADACVIHLHQPFPASFSFFLFLFSSFLLSLLSRFLFFFLSSSLFTIITHPSVCSIPSLSSLTHPLTQIYIPSFHLPCLFLLLSCFLVSNFFLTSVFFLSFSSFSLFA